MREYNSSWHRFKPTTNHAEGNISVEQIDKERFFQIEIANRITDAIAHSQKIKYEASTGLEWDSTDILGLSGQTIERRSPGVGLVLAIINTLNADQKNPREVLDRQRRAQADVFNQLPGRDLDEINRNIKVAVDEFLHITTSEQPKYAVAPKLLQINKDTIFKLLPATPLQNEQEIQDAWGRLNSLGSLREYDRLSSLKQQLKKKQFELDLLAGSSDTSAVALKQQKELKAEIVNLKKEFDSSIAELVEKINDSYSEQTEKALSAQGELINLISDMLGEPEYRDKSAEEIHNLALKKVDIRKAAQVIEDYRSFSSALSTWVSLFDAEAAAHIQSWSEIMCSTAFVAANVYNPAGWFALADSVGKLVVNITRPRKSDPWRKEVLGALRSIEDNIRALHEELTIGLAWMQYGFRQNHRALATVIDGMAALDRDLKTFGILIATSDRKMEEVRLRMILQYNEDWNRQKAEKNSEFYERASMLPQSPEDAKKALEAFVNHSVHDSWSPVHTGSSFTLSNENIHLLPAYISERGVRNIPALIHSYVTESLGKDLPGFRTIQPPTKPSDFEDVQTKIPKVIRNSDEYISGVMEIIRANQAWPKDYARLNEAQRQLLIDVAESILRNDRALLAPEILDALVTDYKDSFQELIQYLGSLEQNPQIRFQAGLGPHLNLNNPFTQFNEPIPDETIKKMKETLPAEVIFDEELWVDPILQSLYPKKHKQRDALPDQKEVLLGNRSTLTPDQKIIHVPSFILMLAPEGRQLKALSQSVTNSYPEVNILCQARVARVWETRTNLKNGNSWAQFESEQYLTVDYILTLTSPILVTKDNPKGVFLMFEFPGGRGHKYQSNHVRWAWKYSAAPGYLIFNTDERTWPYDRPVGQTARVNALKNLNREVIESGQALFRHFHAYGFELFGIEEAPGQLGTQIQALKTDLAKPHPLKPGANIPEGIPGDETPTFFTPPDALRSEIHRITYSLWRRKQAELLQAVALEFNNSSSRLNQLLNRLEASRLMLIAPLVIGAEEVLQSDPSLSQALESIPSSSEISRLILRLADLSSDKKFGPLVGATFPEICNGLEVHAVKQISDLQAALTAIEAVRCHEGALGNPGIKEVLKMLKDYKSNVPVH